MKKNLLLLMLCLFATVMAKAGVSVNGTTYTVGNPGNLATWNSTSSDESVVVKGTMNDADVKVLGKKFPNATIINMDAVTFDTDVKLSDITSSKVNYLALPQAITSISANDMTNCTALLYAISRNLNEGSLGFAAYSKVGGSIASKSPGSAFGWDYSITANYVTIAGELGRNSNGSSDIAPNVVIGWGKIKSMDISNAHFTDISILRMSDYSTYNETLENVKLPTASDITEIPDNSFQGFKALTSIDIPSNYITIGSNAFNNDALLKNITLHKNLKTLGSNCFSQCPSIDAITLPVGLEDVGDYAFYLDPGITSIVIPEGVKRIGKETFWQSNVQSVRLPNTLETIDDGAFQQSLSLTSLIIPPHVKTIGVNAFNLCYKLRDIYVLGTGEDGTVIPEIHPTSASDNTLSFDEMEMHGYNTYPTYTSSDKFSAKDYQADALKTERTGNMRFVLLHYPVTKKSEFVDPLVDNYSRLGSDGLHYPTQEEGEAVRGNQTASTNFGWKRFVLSAPYKPENVIPVPSITDDSWYTMCFPFSMTKAQIETAFGSGTEVCDFVGVRKVEDGTKTDMVIDFTTAMFNASTGADEVITKAGVSYMIHPSTAPENGKEIVFRVTGVEATTDVATSKVGIAEQNGTNSGNNTKLYGDYEYYTGYEFQGNLSTSKTYLNIDRYYLGKTGNTDNPKAFYRHTDSSVKVVWKKNTAIVTEGMKDGVYNGFHSGTKASATQSGTTTSGAKEMAYLSFGHEGSSDSTTGISNTTNETENAETASVFANNVYNLNGQLVRKDSTSMDGLAKGIYIVNGKKYIVK